MSNGIYVALSGAIAQSTALDSTAQNIANASTDGYQRQRPVFREVLARATGARVPMHFTTLSGTPIDTSAGGRRVTGNPLDAALPEGTYLAVSTPRGERYTRACSLAFSADGTLRTASGAAVMNEAGQPIVVRGATERVGIAPDGTLRTPDGTVARLRLVTFNQPGMLQPEGTTLLGAPARAGTARPITSALDVGAVEESNASVVGSMTDLISVSRRFDAFQRAIDTFREADRRIVTVASSTG